jgi:hypothetical protein
MIREFGSMSLPTTGEEFTKLIEHLRKAQEAAAMLSHLEADNSEILSHGWLKVSEMLKTTVIRVTELATRGKVKWN